MGEKFIAGKVAKVVAFLLVALSAAACLSLGVVAFASGRFVAASGDASMQEDAAGAWQMLRAKEDNFSIQLPVPPEIRGNGQYRLGAADGEFIDEERVASAYHKGVVYLVRMYTTSDPKRLFSKYPSVMRFDDAEQSNVRLGSIEGKQYVKRGEGYVHLIRLFPTKKRLYVLEAAARNGSNTAIERFMSSLTLGDAGTTPSAAAPSVAATTNATQAAPLPVASDQEPLSEKEVTRPAIIIYRPQPRYPAAAKQMRASGSVKYSVVLSPSGEVTDIRLAQPQARSLSGATDEVVKSIKFLPAEKDGRLVPQRSEVLYHFELRW
ncbi:MAG TPA: energy transducer TonB [Pyrinomonadaceae bacterium]|jgi:TonB family protein